MSKFNVGDKVRVRSDLKIDNRYKMDGDRDAMCLATPSMVAMAGNVVEISSIDEYGLPRYRLVNSYCAWVDEMFSGLATEPPRREFIVIRRSGAETIAELRHDREVIKSGKAICNTSDTFDFDTGAKLAFDRLMGREEPKPAPQPAHRFKVGDRVVTSFGAGWVKRVDANSEKMPYYIEYDIGVTLWRKSNEAKPEPAPEPPKFYTGKVFAVSVSDNCPMYNRVNCVFEIVNGSAGERGKAYGIGEAPFLSFKHLCERLYGNEWREVKE
ncbi:hypothetical protein SDC9_67344 [bioreactor metagenome]|uniref:Uncharacterized protein n=1 Tax=bioreactor metagenome TaxID=1076179 RepID=A0A644XXB6_9ZZZZ